MTLPETYSSQVQHIQSSPKFQKNSEGSRQAVPFPGYTVITPPAEEESQNSAFYKNLNAWQQQLLQLPLDSGLIVPVPAASLHLTLADLIWNDAYYYAMEKSEFEEHLRYEVAQSFQKCQRLKAEANQIQWQMLGLMVMPRAIAVCLVPKDESSYLQVLQLRRTIYQNSSLSGLGIEQHYHFTAHITLGYFGELSPNLDRDRLGNILSESNQQWLENLPEFKIHRAELRKFDDMTHYYREPDWPVLEL